MGTCAFMVAAIIAMITLKPQGYLPVKARPVFSGQVVNELCQVDIHLKGINQSSANVDFVPDDHAFTCSTLNYHQSDICPRFSDSAGQPS